MCDQSPSHPFHSKIQDPVDPHLAHRHHPEDLLNDGSILYKLDNMHLPIEIKIKE